MAVDMTNDDVATLIAAFAMIGQDVAQRGLKGKAVISCSLTASESSITEIGIAKLRRVLGVLVSLDVAIILSAGNYGGEINTYPPMLADELPLITVGAVDDKGEIASWSQGGPLLTTAAGGVGIVCATNEGADAYRIKQGTSFGKYPKFKPLLSLIYAGDHHTDHLSSNHSCPSRRRHGRLLARPP